MLILQRRAGESLYIGEQIKITVVSVDPGRVRLAIDAPQDITILRSELKVAMEANRESAQEDTSPLALNDLVKALEPKAAKPGKQ